MVIRPMTAAFGMGEIGRSVSIRGDNDGSAAFLRSGDVVSLGGPRRDAGLYSGALLFKMMGAVELMSDDREVCGQSGFDDNPTLL